MYQSHFEAQQTFYGKRQEAVKLDVEFYTSQDNVRV